LFIYKVYLVCNENEILWTILMVLTHVRFEPNFFLCDSLPFMIIIELALTVLKLFVSHALLR